MNHAGIELPAEPAPSDDTVATVNRHEPEPGSESYTKQQQVRAFLALSKKRWQTADAASTAFRMAMRKDQLFASGGGNQWETEDRQARADEGRPCIEINRIPQFIRQVSNQNRANRSQIKISPRGSGSTLKLASAIQGLVRGIEVESDADVAYDTGTQHQLTSGLGFVRLVAAWGPGDAWSQVCRLKRVRNPLAVYWDPSTQEADFSDCRWMHVIGVVGKDEYEARWGKVASYQSLSEYMAGQRTVDDWAPEGKVVIAEYYYVDVEEKVQLRMHTGQTIWKDDLEKFQQMYQLAHPGEAPADVVAERPVDKKVVHWCFHNGLAILEGNEEKTAGRELPGTRIPVYPVMGDEIDCDGTIDYRGMVRDAIDPQRMYNFWSSSIAEAVALAPKAPWVAAKGQIEQYMSDWKDANRKAKAVLLYDPKAVGDQLVPPPQRNTVEPAIQAMTMGLAEADRDLMSVMGLFQPSLGERGSHSESGKAREALVEQGVVANSNFLDNLQRTKRSIGRSLLEWIPVIYDVPRIEHLLHPDGKKKAAVIYSGDQNKPQPGEFTNDDGSDMTEMYDVSVLAFDVTVSTGPSHETQRQATQAWLLELFKVLPQLAAIGADILLENSDDEAAQQLGKRFKKALPPQFQDEGDPEAQLPILQAKLQQTTDLLDKAHAAIGTMAKVIESKEIESDTKKEVAMIAANAQLAVAASKMGNERDQAAFSAEFERFQGLVDQIHAETIENMQQDHEARLTREAQAHDEQQASAQREHETATQAADQQHEATQQQTEQRGTVGQIREQREADEAVAAAQPKPASPKK